MQTPNPAPNRFRTTAILLLILLALLAVFFITTLPPKNITCPITFSPSATPTATNADYVFLTVTNQADAQVVYLACPAQTNLNGFWFGPPLPGGQAMTILTPRQSGLLVLPATALQEKVRVPVLWGYYDYAPRATKSQRLIEDLHARLAGRDGVGRLYTNYLTNLKP